MTWPKRVRLPVLTLAERDAMRDARVGELVIVTDAQAGETVQCWTGSGWWYVVLGEPR